MLLSKELDISCKWPMVCRRMSTNALFLAKALWANLPAKLGSETLRIRALRPHKHGTRSDAARLYRISSQRLWEHGYVQSDSWRQRVGIDAIAYNV